MAYYMYCCGCVLCVKDAGLGQENNRKEAKQKGKSTWGMMRAAKVAPTRLLRSLFVGVM